MSKDLSYNICSHYLSSDQWLQCCVTEDFTYEEYCESAGNNNMTVFTLGEYNECRDHMEDQAALYGWGARTDILDPTK